MTEWIEVRNRSRQGVLVARAQWCATFLCRLRGLTFRNPPAPGEGLLLVEGRESKFSSSIHMWFVFRSLGIVWLNSEATVVDLKLARPWAWYVPQAPARYVLEAAPPVLALVELGDQLVFETHASSS